MRRFVLLLLVGSLALVGCSQITDTAAAASEASTKAQEALRAAQDALEAVKSSGDSTSKESRQKLAEADTKLAEAATAVKDAAANAPGPVRPGLEALAEQITQLRTSIAEATSKSG